MRNVFLESYVVLFIISLSACKQTNTLPPTTVKSGDTGLAKISSAPDTASAITIFSRKQIPILCYHQLREWRISDSRVAKDYIVPPGKFASQLKLLADSGYQTILPDQLVRYLKTGTGLPEKPVMLTYDDTDLTHFEVAAAEMKKYNFKGVFFIMTVSIGRPGYMSSEQIKQLSSEGHIIGCHTWDHHNVKKYKPEDWKLQVEKPIRQLQAITGSPVKYFAFPFGLWNEEAIDPLKQYGFTAAFQLTEKRSISDPLYTIRRMIVPGYWELNTLQKSMRNNF